MIKFLTYRFQRVTTTGAYVAEIDGLRFIAISSVLFVHINGIWMDNVRHPYAGMSGFDNLLNHITLLGGYGVQLFFMISGFVLAMPFCAHAFHGAKPVSLPKYFWRRVTRLEPPYILSMLFFFLMMPAWNKGGYAALLPHLLASLAYVHNIIYHAGSVINNNAWSLEVEIQFYLLVPLILKMLFWKSQVRRISLVLLAVAFSLNPLWLPAHFPITIFQSFQYFAIGILFCDLWSHGWQHLPRNWWTDGMALAAWPVFFWVNLECSKLITNSINPWLIALLFLAALRGRLHGRMLRWGLVPIIGGMCYSIYLLHARVISLVLHYGFGHFRLTGNFSLDFLILCLGTFPLVIIACSVFFLLIEKPCMNPRWPQKLWEHFRNRNHETAKAAKEVI